MADTSPRGAAPAPLQGSHNPFDDPRPKRNKGVTIAIVISIIVHAALFIYLWTSKFQPNFKEYSDDVTDVAMVKPVPPPPPPPPPNTPPPPPPKLQPRPPVAAPDVPSIPPLPVPPVEHRIEQPKPPAPPPPEPPRPSVITSPDWLRKPTGDDIAKYYPERAQRMNVEGRATIHCTVNARGTLESCSVQSEAPDNQDFGSKALQLSKLFKMRPQTKDGAPVDGGQINIPIRFQLPKG